MQKLFSEDSQIEKISYQVERRFMLESKLALNDLLDILDIEKTPKEDYITYTLYFLGSRVGGSVKRLRGYSTSIVRLEDLRAIETWYFEQKSFQDNVKTRRAFSSIQEALREVETNTFWVNPITENCYKYCLCECYRKVFSNSIYRVSFDSQRNYNILDECLSEPFLVGSINTPMAEIKPLLLGGFTSVPELPYKVLPDNWQETYITSETLSFINSFEKGV
jgi:hypothetical protein